ncbi:MAG: hypothetical protein AB1567_04990 [bacterium]
MMRYGQYSIKFDRTGFPLVQKEGWNYYISLFPVSKYQFERFMAENGPKENLYTDNWYRELLELNPQGPWRMCDERPWELFITGLNKVEITPFLKYLGKGFRLPKIIEWRNLFNAEVEIQKIGLKDICKEACALPVSLWLKNGLFPLTKEGLLEMVEDSSECIGRPHQQFLPNTWQPDETKEVNWDIGKKFVGFRVVNEVTE